MELAIETENAEGQTLGGGLSGSQSFLSVSGGFAG